MSRHTFFDQSQKLLLQNPAARGGALPQGGPGRGILGTIAGGIGTAFGGPFGGILATGGINILSALLSGPGKRKAEKERIAEEKRQFDITSGQVSRGQNIQGIQFLAQQRQQAVGQSRRNAFNRDLLRARG